jgi:hypothetical protein
VINIASENSAMHESSHKQRISGKSLNNPKYNSAGYTLFALEVSRIKILLFSALIRLARLVFG